MQEYLDAVDQKLTVLSLICQVGRSLTVNELTEALASENVMNFFEVSQAVSKLTEENQLEQNDRSYSLTEEGTRAVEYFATRLPFTVTEKLRILSDRMKRKEEAQQLCEAHCFPLSETEYQVSLNAREEVNAQPLTLQFSVIGKENAKQICKTWEEHYTDLYSRILELLTRKD